MSREAVYRRSLALADVMAAALALLATVAMGDGQLRPATLGLPVVVILVAKLYGLYDRDELLVRKTTLDEAPTLFQAATLYALGLLLAHDVLVTGDVTSTQVITLWALIFAGSILLRVVARACSRRFTPDERCVLVGDAGARRRLEPKLTGPSTGAIMVDHVTLETDGGGSGPSILSRDEIHRLVEAHDAHRVIVAPGGIGGDEVLDVIGAVKECGARVSVLPRLMEVVGSSVQFDHLGGVTLLGVHRFGLSRSSRIIKRTLDLFVAFAGWVVIAPLFGAIALAVALGSRGPVFFRQTRVGRNGRRFEMLKFRTMVVDAHEQRGELHALNETEGLFKMADDPRVTGVGRLLRRLSLDELPQLWNVLRGEMSLVGPRPLVVAEDELIVGRHRRRLQLKPGMTGQWQVLGSSRPALQEMLTIDYLYAANWSLWLDLKILARTVPHILGRRGL